MNQKNILLVIFSIFLFSNVEAQILKKITKKIEEKLEQRAENKADRSVDKILDKADQKTDSVVDDMLTADKKPKADKKSKTSTTKSVLMPMPEARPDQSMKIMGDRCSDFYWFTEGAKLTYEVKQPNGKVIEKTKMEINSVKTENGIKSADIKASSLNNQEIEMKYMCTDDKFYIDFSATMKDILKKMGKDNESNEMFQNVMNNTEIDLSEGYMAIPKSLYPGMILDEVKFSLKTSLGSGMEMVVQSNLVDRFVTKREKITTPAGSFDCMVIVGTSKTTMSIMGRNQNMPDRFDAIWIAPGYGMVKQESYSDKLKLESTLELIEFSK